MRWSQVAGRSNCSGSVLKAPCETVSGFLPSSQCSHYMNIWIQILSMLMLIVLILLAISSHGLRTKYRQLFLGDLPLALFEDMTFKAPNKRNYQFLLANMTSLKQGRRDASSLEEYTAIRKTERQKTAGNSEKPTSLKGNTNWREITQAATDASLSPRGQPIGNETLTSEFVGSSPDRVFKVVFLGNSGVGKSSFIHHFCYNRFLAQINATIGIDYRVKSLMVDNRLVVLQLWDTAGQERFQSITKQYFRRADGILIMYDITAECSFMAVRNWMSCVLDVVDDGAVIFLLGNKIDAAGKKAPEVPRTEGERLAKEYKAVFYECSAMTGYNILEPMLHMARLLTAHEDKQRDRALHLEECNPRKGCCV